MWLRVAQDAVKEDEGRDPLLGPGPHLLPIALLPFVGYVWNRFADDTRLYCGLH
jgi:hypothetical protein